ncbi:MAG TPA: DivIVA domain-containing protein, partial [Acidimicrobiia bacterium]|nr:DivIVA domain-containing protein [Acidimicrobiia bacterium]
MTETDRRQRLITSTPHLSPEEVASRSFATGFRGYSETEVRGFLKRVSEQLAAERERERELEGAVDALEEQLRQPRPLNEKELLDALGEETARLLRSAREASENIRRKSEELAAERLEEATTAAERMRTEAEQILMVRTQEAEERVAEIMAAVHTRVKELSDAATAESEGIVEAARAHGREMLDEAKAARERVLGDLVRRRALPLGGKLLGDALQKPADLGFRI